VTRGAPATGAEVSADTFRAACAQFATGVTVVTTATPEGDFGVTVNAFTSLTLEPPQVVVCLARTSNTWGAIERARVFAVNVLAADQVAVGLLFATKHPDKFGVARAASHRGVAGVPLLDGALATLECRLADAIPRDTHVMLVGQVVNVRHNPAKDPALFFRSGLYEGFTAAARRTPTPRDP
jgi:3-hydroxy-9,10-secoandrosta-1,3,5(10)-triene-9,17-dione monooxygenase reductase component